MYSTPWKLIYGVLCVWISSYSPASNIFHFLCHPIALMDPKIAIYENFSQKLVVVYRTKFKAFQNISGACFFYRVYRKVYSCKWICQNIYIVGNCIVFWFYKILQKTNSCVKSNYQPRPNQNDTIEDSIWKLLSTFLLTHKHW